MYIDAFFDKKTDLIRVVERRNGKREFKEYPARYTFYYDDPKGKFRSIHRNPVSRVVCKNTSSFKKEKAIHNNNSLYESDVNPINQCLTEHYNNSQIPQLHVAFWDIETDFCPKRGFSSPSDPFSPIISISIFLEWENTMITLAIPPRTLNMTQAYDSVKEWGDTVILFNNEKEMLTAFLDIIDDVDVLSGWNCSTYDIPYTVNRVTQVLSKNDSRRMCLWSQFPKARSFERFGKEQKTFDLIGRINLDYLDLYKKYTYEERASYKLDSIGELELGERKTEYEGTLDDLYNKDFNNFIRYNRQDVALLNKLDKKFEYIDLTISSAHENTVLIKDTMGSVAMIEQAIINEAHAHGMVVPDKRKINDDESFSIAGGYVGVPRRGIHKWIGSIDLNSLYPSVIRSLNLATETLIGQIRHDRTNKLIYSAIEQGHTYSSVWDKKFACVEYEIVMDQRIDENIIIDWEDGRTEEMSGAQAYKLIFDSNKKWTLTANGTLFNYENRGIIPELLTRWYNERKLMQRQKSKWSELNDGIKLPERLL